MAITATTAVWEHSRTTGNARLVLLALADHVNEQRIQAGYAWEAWPSQSTLAKMCGCSRSTVQLALDGGVELGEITDTGKRRRRGTIVWEILLDLTDSESGHSDLTDSRSGEGEGRGDLTDSRHDLTDSEATSPILGHVPDRPIGHEPEVPEVESEEGTGSAPSAADLLDHLTAKEEKQRLAAGEPFDPERRELLAQLRDDHLSVDERQRIFQRLRELDGEEITMDIWARRLPALLEAVPA